MRHAPFVFLLLPFWQGNRTIHYWLRKRIERLHRPVWKFAALLATNVLFTIPASIVIFAVWCGPFYAIDRTALWRPSGAAVLFVSHA